MIHVLGSITIDYAFALTQLPAAEIVIGDRPMPTPGNKRANQAAKRAGVQL